MAGVNNGNRRARKEKYATVARVLRLKSMESRRYAVGNSLYVINALKIGRWKLIVARHKVAHDNLQSEKPTI